LDHSCQVQRHPVSARGADLYETPVVATQALLRVENLPHHIWEPRRDFLLEPLPPSCEAIVTNPPFRLAEEFIAHALELCPRVVMLLRLAFLESERRCHILENRGLARVHVFRKRLPMMHRDGWKGRKANSGMAFAWFVWDRGHIGPASVNRISWDR
jgi:hypothetical protein